MARTKAVIDTNVLHAGLYSASGASFQILRYIEQGRLTPVLSTTLLFEYEEVLRRNRLMLDLSEQDTEDVLDGLCSRGEFQRIYFLWRPELADPKDDHVLELAIACGGATIVTHNIRDFASAAKFGVPILRPAEMLRRLQ